MDNFEVSRPRGRPSRDAENNNQRNQDHWLAAEQMSMFTFFSTYYRRTRNSTVWSIYEKKPIIRVFPRLTPQIGPQNQVNESFYLQQVKLHVPWDTDFETHLNPNQLEWSEIYRQHLDIIPNHLDIPEAENEQEDEFEQEDQIDYANIDLHEWMIYTRMRPGEEPSQARQIPQEAETNHVPMPNVNFSDEQQKVLDVLRAQIQFLQTNIRLPQFHQPVIIQGKAGSGKSTLIQAITAILHEEIGPGSYIAMAPTGAAASSIKAVTVH